MKTCRLIQKTVTMILCIVPLMASFAQDATVAPDQKDNITMINDNNGRFNVRNFEAKGDGKTDDTIAFQKAIDAAAKVKGTVFVPAGTYRIGKLKWHDFTSMVGDPGWSYYIPGGSILELNDENASCMIDFTYCQGSRLFGLSLVGRKLGKGIHGIMTRPHDTNEKPDKWKHEDFPAIERSMITGFTGNGLDMDVWCLSLRGCAIGYNNGDGFNYKHADAMVVDNWFSNNNGAGIRAVQGTGSSTFTANRIEWNRGGNMIVQNAWGWNITGNCFDRAGGPGLYLVGNCHDFTITGNQFLRSGAKLDNTKLLGNFDNCAVRMVNVNGLTFTGNNTTTGGGDPGSRKIPDTPDYGIIINDLSNAVITGNRICAVKQPLLDLGEHGENVIIRDNVLQTKSELAKREKPEQITLTNLKELPELEKLAEKLSQEKLFTFSRTYSKIQNTSDGQIATEEPIGLVLGEIRLAVSNNNLLLHSRVFNGNSTEDVKDWSQSAIELYIWTPDMPKSRQFKLVPSGPDGKVKTECYAWVSEKNGNLTLNSENADCTLKMTPVKPCGYEISAIIPFNKLGLKTDANSFYMEMAVYAAEKYSYHHMTAFHSVGPLFINKPGDFFAPVKF